MSPGLDIPLWLVELVIVEFRYVQGQPLEVTPEMIEAWNEDGAFIVK